MISWSYIYFLKAECVSIDVISYFLIRGKCPMVPTRAAGVGISKPIRYFELNTDIFDIFVLQSFFNWGMLNWVSLNIYHLWEYPQNNHQTNSTILNRYWGWYRNSDILIFIFVKFHTNILKYFQTDTKYLVYRLALVLIYWLVEFCLAVHHLVKGTMSWLVESWSYWEGNFVL